MFGNSHMVVPGSYKRIAMCHQLIDIKYTSSTYCKVQAHTSSARSTVPALQHWASRSAGRMECDSHSLKAHGGPSSNQEYSGPAPAKPKIGTHRPPKWTSIMSTSRPPSYYLRRNDLSCSYQVSRIEFFLFAGAPRRDELFPSFDPQ